MKIRNIFHCFVVGALLLSASPVLSQAPALGVQLYAGLTINGSTGRLYAVQASTDLSSSNWTCLDLVRATSTNFQWTDTSKSAANGQRFYRTISGPTNLIYILPGAFTMGSPTNEALRGSDETQHVVTLSRGIYMGQFLVTQSEYQSVVGNNPSFHTGNSNYPVENVSWFDASNYCALRTLEERVSGLIPTNWIYRLPTEAEWEYGCRAGTVTAFYLGSALHSQQANFIGTNEYDSVIGRVYNPSGVSVKNTTAGGSYAANGWGLYDMAGNLLEWCQDWYGDYPGTVSDPSGPATGTAKVRRGGSWGSGASVCRSASRFPIDPTITGSGNGFRVVLAPTP